MGTYGLKCQTAAPNIASISNPFQTYVSFLYPLKTLQNFWFPEVFMGYRKRPVT